MEEQWAGSMLSAFCCLKREGVDGQQVLHFQAGNTCFSVGASVLALASPTKRVHRGEHFVTLLSFLPQMVEDGHSGDSEKAVDEVFHCPVCFKEFVCKYGLETHMETHSDNPLR